MNEELEVIAKEDYRLQAVTTLSKDWKSPFTGINHPKDSPIKSVAVVSFKESQITFGLPNMTALFIDYAYILSEESSVFLKDGGKYSTENSGDHKIKSIFPKSEEQFFDLLQKRMGAIVFAFSALEAFANEVIPDDYIHEKLREDGRCIEKYNKTQIERVLSLDIKLSEILPNILKVDNPKNKKLWNKYKIIKDLRDRIIHIKTHDRRSVSLKEKSIWGDLLSEDYPNFGLLSYRIIAHYYSSTLEDKIPRWFRKFPFREQAKLIRL